MAEGHCGRQVRLRDIASIEEEEEEEEEEYEDKYLRDNSKFNPYPINVDNLVSS